ncbi:MAG: hypothetical protein AB1758_32000, partial [Candidatus Eremiobacterota bacterium]
QDPAGPRPGAKHARWSVSIVKFVCLANSRKITGRCVAGKDPEDPARWIRPVSARPEGELSEEERRYSDGRDPSLLDIVTVTVKGPAPKGCQTENYLIDEDCYWLHGGRIAWTDLPGLEDTVTGPLWWNGDSTRNGQNDRVPVGLADTFDYSLRFIHTPRLHLRVFAPSADFGNPKRRVQALFQVAGHEYRLWVTDPVVERQRLASPQEFHDVHEAYLTLSLGEPCPHDQCCYKLVAAILTPDRFR